MLLLCVYFEKAAASCGIWEPFASALRKALAAQIGAAGVPVSAAWERSETTLSKNLTAKLRVARVCVSSGALERQKTALWRVLW